MARILGEIPKQNSLTIGDEVCFLKTCLHIVKYKNKETLSPPGRFGFLTEPTQSVLLILNFTIFLNFTIKFSIKHKNRAKELSFTLFRVFCELLVAMRSYYRERPFGIRGERRSR